MRIRLLLPLSVMMIFVYLWNPTEAAACSCVMPPPPEEALNDAHAVFSGEVIGISDNVKIINGYGKTVRFKVNESWKGIESAEVAIATGNSGGDCGFQFEEGQSYLVYASKSDMYSKNTLATTICHRTTLLSNAADDLNELGEGKVIPASENDKEVPNETSTFIWIVGSIALIGVVLSSVIFYFKRKDNASS